MMIAAISHRITKSTKKRVVLENDYLAFSLAGYICCCWSVNIVFRNVTVGSVFIFRF